MKNTQKRFAGAMAILSGCLLLSFPLLAHNGKIAYARPLGTIKIDGDLSDWPQTAEKHRINTILSDSKPGEADYTGFFQLGYRLEDSALYIAFTITDDDFIEDTAKSVAWNTQDNLELDLDIRHLPGRSGIASFLYSKNLRYINKAHFDPFAGKATWDIMEVAMTQKGNTRYYEWRVKLGNQLVIGRSIGLDVMVFDKDADKSFTYAGWGRGGSKYMTPSSLGDIIFLPAQGKLSTVTGTIGWDKPLKDPLPRAVRFTSTQNPQTWFQVEVDSTGKYEGTIPAGRYTVQLPDAWFRSGKELYATARAKPVMVTTKPGNKVVVPAITIPATPAPDLVPAQGVLHQFTAATPAQIDRFITTYQQYYNIPGVSLALIKDGKVVYHKTYGVRNTFTGQPVDSLTLFEAASVTKPVFAYTVQRLEERGIINLDTPLYRYLPYKDIEYDERYKLITARHVLTHRTGFPNWRSMNPGNKLDLKFTPGTQYNYSGEGFEYLKMVVEKITGKKVEQVLKEEVVEPIGLYHTFWSRNDSLRRMVADGHVDGLPNHDDLPESPGMAWSMHTEALIFTRFMLQLLEQKGLSAATYERMFQKHSDYNFDPGEEKPKMPVYMGVSLEIRETPFGKSFGHGGNNGDFRCNMEVYKDLKMGYVIFTNSSTSVPLLEAIPRFLVDGKQP